MFNLWLQVPPHRLTEMWSGMMWEYDVLGRVSWMTVSLVSQPRSWDKADCWWSGVQVSASCRGSWVAATVAHRVPTPQTVQITAIKASGKIKAIDPGGLLRATGLNVELLTQEQLSDI